MTTRRSFFRKLAGVCGVIALAPQLCFRVPIVTFRENYVGIYEQLRRCDAMVEPGPLDLQKLIQLCYEIKKRREHDAEYQKAFSEIFKV